MKEGSVCVTKSDVPYSSIGTDHETEQENQALKVLSGIKDSRFLPKSGQVFPVSSRNG